MENMINVLPNLLIAVTSMTLIEYLKDIITMPSVVIFGAITLIEVAPIRINPWHSLLKWIGQVINGGLQTQMTEMKNELSDLKKDCELKNADDMRWEILNFANTCRQGVKHSKDEWRHVMDQLAKYEDYTESKGISNGVIEEDTRYLRELYHDRNSSNDFI